MIIDESKKHKAAEPSTPATKGLIIKRSKLFQEHLKTHEQNTPGVGEGFKKFIADKMTTPTAPSGSKDYALGKEGQFGKVPGLKHAGLTNDVSVFYTLSGKDPHTVHLYGIMSHDEAGIGQPANINRQKNAAKKFAGQIFEKNEEQTT